MAKQQVVYAIPVFLAFMLGEVWIARRRQKPYYRLNDTLANITLGVGNLGVGVAVGGLHLAIYLWCWEHRAFTVPRTWAAFALFVLLEDLAYYWFHRVSHVSRVFWAAHETHHSTPEYNLAAAVRQTWTGWPHGWIFWAPLPLLGFPIEWLFLQQAVSLVYQFFLHTRLVPKLGPLEWVMNTPSHHRVHHGTEVKYLDRNYAGIFIVWDRLFGTFEEEAEEPTYGVTHQLGTDNPLFIAFHAWWELARDVWRAPTLLAKVKYALAPPGWNHEGTGLTAAVLQARERAERAALRAPAPAECARAPLT